MEKLKKTELGIEENTEAALAYFLFWITGLIFLIIEKNKFVKFHALQSTILFGFFTVIFILLSPFHLIPFINIISKAISFCLLIICLIFWVLGMIKAYQHEYFKFPLAGEIAEKNV
jgi:uncharacterized membrane protein